MRGETTTEAEAAGQNVAEALIKWAAWLDSKFKGGETTQRTLRSG